MKECINCNLKENELTKLECLSCNENEFYVCNHCLSKRTYCYKCF